MPADTERPRPICSNCNYDLSETKDSARCPECGKPLVEVMSWTGRTGYRFRSKATLWGLPAIDIALGPTHTERIGRAKGVIAIGDRATPRKLQNESDTGYDGQIMLVTNIRDEKGKPIGTLPDGEVSRARRVAAFRRLLDKLSEKKRTVFVLHELEGLSPAEIAVTVDCPVMTVRTRLFYARRELAQLMHAEPSLAALLDGSPGEGSAANRQATTRKAQTQP